VAADFCQGEGVYEVLGRDGNVTFDRVEVDLQARILGRRKEDIFEGEIG
jgi:hypothetical protein